MAVVVDKAKPPDCKIGQIEPRLVQERLRLRSGVFALPSDEDRARAQPPQPLRCIFSGGVGVRRERRRDVSAVVVRDRRKGGPELGDAIVVQADVVGGKRASAVPRDEHLGRVAAIALNEPVDGRLGIFDCRRHVKVRVRRMAQLLHSLVVGEDVAGFRGAAVVHALAASGRRMLRIGHVWVSTGNEWQDYPDEALASGDAPAVGAPIAFGRQYCVAAVLDDDRVLDGRVVSPIRWQIQRVKHARRVVAKARGGLCHSPAGSGGGTKHRRWEQVCRHALGARHLGAGGVGRILGRDGRGASPPSRGSLAFARASPRSRVRYRAERGEEEDHGHCHGRW